MARPDRFGGRAGSVARARGGLQDPVARPISWSIAPLDTDIRRGYSVGVDGVALVLVLLTTVLVPLLLVAGWNDGGRAATRHAAYVALTCSTVESMVLISVISLDVLLFYVFFEAMLIPMYFLIGGFGGGVQVAGRLRHLRSRL